MNKMLSVIAITILLVLTSMIIPPVLGVKIGASEESNIIYVDDVAGEGLDNPPENFTSIQDAINNASNGDTIYVYNGTYIENIVVNKSITLVGEDRDSTIIDGNATGDVLSICVDYVNVNGFKIRNSGSDIFSNYDAGIDIRANFSHISYNEIVFNNGYGIILMGGIPGNYYADIHDNLIFKNNFAGIYLIHTNHSNICKNTVSGNNVGIVIAYVSTNNMIKNNTISNSSEYSIGIFSNNNIISNNEIIDSLDCLNESRGIYASLINQIEISDNNIINNIGGIYLSKVTNSTIFKNIVSNNEWGIYMQEDSQNNTIFENNITSNNMEGVCLTNSSVDNLLYHNNFRCNTVHANDTGNNSWDNGVEGNYWDDFDNESEGAYDNNTDGIVDSPYNISDGDNKDNYPLMEPYVYVNHAPETPSAPVGPENGFTGVSYEYEFNAIDPDGDMLYFIIDWGGGIPVQYGSFNSETTIEIPHIWVLNGIYNISMKAKDINGAENNWSENLTVNITTKALEPKLNISFAMLGICFGKIRANIYNSGELDCKDVEWEINVSKALTGKKIASNNGTDDINSGEILFIHTGLNSIKRRFGLVDVTVTAKVDGYEFKQSNRGIVFGRFFFHIALHFKIGNILF